MKVRSFNLKGVNLFTLYIFKVSDFINFKENSDFGHSGFVILPKVKQKAAYDHHLKNNDSALRINFVWHNSHSLFGIQLLIWFLKSDQTAEYPQTSPCTATREAAFPFVPFLGHSLRQLNRTESGTATLHAQNPPPCSAVLPWELCENTSLRPLMSATGVHYRNTGGD